MICAKLAHTNSDEREREREDEKENRKTLEARLPYSGTGEEMRAHIFR